MTPKVGWRDNMRPKRPRNLNYSETVRFHGHDGPFLALGYRLGRFLVRKLKPDGIMGLQITVKTKMQKPWTCLIDGLQCSTFATLGKGNLFAKRTIGNDIFVYAQRGKRVLKFRMSQTAWDLCSNVVDLEKAARKVMRTPVSVLWDIVN
jgi:formylmethanofuran dehydrogenase subunit E